MAIASITSSGMEGEKTIIIRRLGMLFPMFLVFYTFCEQTYIHIHTHTYTDIQIDTVTHNMITIPFHLMFNGEGNYSVID